MDQLSKITQFDVGSGGNLSTPCAGRPDARACDLAVNVSGATFLLALALGTGGHVSPGMLDFIHTTGGESIEFRYAPFDNKKKVNVVSTVEQISALKMVLGLSISEIANVLMVQRPTIYSWMSGVEPRKSNTQRIHLLYSVALEWQEISDDRLGNYLKMPIVDGRSLIDLLSEENINIDNVKTILLRINDARLEAIEANPKRSISRRLAEKGYTKLSKEDQAENIRGVGALISGDNE